MINTAGYIPTFRVLTGEDLGLKIIDLGADAIYGAPPYVTLFAGSNTARVVGFEPNPEALAKLNANKSSREIYLPHVIGDGGRHRLHICQASDMTSLLEPNEAVLNLFHGFPHWGKVISIEEVETRRLDDIEETAGAEYIKVDIQGATLLALEHATKRLRDVVVIHCETEFLEMYKGQPLFGDIERFMRGHGFTFHRFSPLVSRMVQPLSMGDDLFAGMSQDFWADSVFIRDLTKLDKLTERQLLVMAGILHDCYQSFDVVVHLLIAYDRRTGRELAGTYLNHLRSSATPQAA
jgi:FkbM family methyltransferase